MFSSDKLSTPIFYDLLFYLNADDRRKMDCYWRSAYTVVALPLIRNMIDCLYNVTAILQDPRKNGPWFRKSGYRKLLEGLDQDQARYGDDPEWDAWIRNARSEIEFDIRHRMPFTVAEVLAEKEWPTLGKYINMQQPGGTYTSHQMFLRTLLYGKWREYSAMAHVGSDGLLMTGVLLYRTPCLTNKGPTTTSFCECLVCTLAKRPEYSSPSSRSYRRTFVSMARTSTTESTKCGPC